VIGNNTKFMVEDYEADFLIPDMKTDTSFKKIIGQNKAKKKCKLIEKYLSNPRKFGKWAPKNILFHGPSGTGKTMMAKALANSVDVPLLAVKATKLIGEFVGDGARQIHQLYEKAEELSPCIIFIDEFDAVALNRSFQEIRGDVSEIVNAILTEMDGIDERDGICTIAATNMMAALDPAVRSRFEEEIEFTLPTIEERYKILQSYTRTFPVKLEKDVNLQNIAKRRQASQDETLLKSCSRTHFIKPYLQVEKLHVSNLKKHSQKQ